MSQLNLDEARAILQRTPGVLHALYEGLPQRLLHVNEGPGTWSLLQILQHLIWAEIDDWIPRVRMILDHGDTRSFTPFNREEGFDRYANRNVDELLGEFARIRQENLATLAASVTPADLHKPGRHPEFGPVTLGQLLATWVAHDLGHLVQINRVLAKDVGRHVGPWRAYLSVLK